MKLKCKKFLLSSLLVLALPVTSYAATTQEKLNQAQEEQQQTKDNLEDAKDNLSSLQGTRNALQNQLSDLNTELNAASLHLEDVENQIIDKEGEIAQAEADLQQAEKTANEQYESMLVRIRFMYENGDDTVLEMLFSATSFADFLNKSEYISKVEAYDRRKLEEFRDTCDRVAQLKADLEAELVALEVLKEEADAEKLRVSALVSSTADKVTAYADQIEVTQTQMLAYEAQLEEQNNNIEALKKQLEEEKRLAALAAASAKRDITQITFGENDRYLLANLIYVEAGNQPYEGKLGVGAVVINRMLSSVFPNTMEGVIYQKNQFSPVASGRYALALANNSATASCYQAADAAMAGETTVEDCVFFRTPVDYITPRFKIAGHIFY